MMDLDRVRAAIGAVVRLYTSRLDYAGLQAAKVEKQNSDGTLEVTFEDAKYPPLSQLKLLPPAPGSAVKVHPGARVMVGWLGCSPEFPVAVAWDIGTTVELDLTATTVVLNGGSAGVARVGDSWSASLNGLTAGPYPVQGTITIRAGSSTVKAG